MVKAESVQVIAIRRPLSPAAGGLPLLLWTKGEVVYKRAALF
jgi:hypothetical protein